MSYIKKAIYERKLIVKIAAVLWMCLSPVTLPAIAADQIHLVQLKANEAESMLYLFNQTTVSGTDVELIAQLGAKLEQGMKEARDPADPDRTVALHLNPEEVRYCLAVIRNSTFEARYAGLVMGIKEKLTEALEKTDTEPAAKQRKNG
jgi:hypothetical protein